MERGVVITIGGRDYPVVPIGIPEIDSLRALTLERRRSPIEAIMGFVKGVPGEQGAAMAAEAFRLHMAPVLMSSGEFQATLQSIQGWRLFVFLAALRAGYTGPPEAAYEAADAMSVREAVMVLNAAMNLGDPASLLQGTLRVLMQRMAEERAKQDEAQEV